MWFATFLLKNLGRRKIRTGLATFGVSLPLGAMVALLGISDGFERATVQSFEGRGVHIVVVAEGVLDQLSSNLDEAYGDRIRSLPGVKAVGPGLIDLVGYSKGNNTISVVVQGWPPDAFMFESLEVLSGRRIQPGDRHKAMLGVTLAENLGKKAGDTIEIQRQPFEIVGIYRSPSFFEDGAITVALGDLQRAMLRDHSVTGFSVVLQYSGDDQDAVDAAVRQINALTDEQGKPLGLSARPTKEYANSSVHIRMAHAMAWLTSAIAVIVGAAGILNAMIMSVVERIAEIGTLRAIGWRRSRVVCMVLGESLILSGVGAVLGGAGAVLVTKWLSTLSAASGYIQGDIAPSILLKGFLMALGVGLLGGLYPAYHASCLAPAEGLRHE